MTITRSSGLALFGDFFDNGLTKYLPVSVIPKIFETLDIKLYCPYVIGDKNLYEALSSPEIKAKTKVIPWSDKANNFPIERLDHKLISKLSFSDLTHLLYQDSRLLNVKVPHFAHRQLAQLRSIQYWINVLQENNITHALSNRAPHYVYDYCFFLACKLCGIPFRYFSPISIFPDLKCLIDLDTLSPIKLKSSSNYPKINIDATRIVNEDKTFGAYQDNALKTMNTVKANAKKYYLEAYSCASNNHQHRLFREYIEDCIADFQNCEQNSRKIYKFFQAPFSKNSQEVPRW